MNVEGDKEKMEDYRLFDVKDNNNNQHDQHIHNDDKDNDNDALRYPFQITLPTQLSCDGRRHELCPSNSS